MGDFSKAPSPEAPAQNPDKLAEEVVLEVVIELELKADDLGKARAELGVEEGPHL